MRRALGLALVVLAGLPALASAHAGLVKAGPVANKILSHPPDDVRLSFSEEVEPRFAQISVTDASGRRMTTGRAVRPVGGGADDLGVPLRTLRKGWYLVFWRVISADGHPVRGAYTFAVGPNAGPPPKFDTPSLSESAATGGLLAARWVALLSLLAAIGLVAFRLVIARPLALSLRAVEAALWGSLGLAIAATLVYVNAATARFAQIGFLDLGTTISLIRDSSFGRGYSDLALVLVALALATWIAVRVDRRDGPRSIAALLAAAGAFLAAGAALLAPGLAGHAAQYAPRGGSLALDWVHLLAGALWLGGLVGIAVLGWRAQERRVEAMVVVVPRFSRVALVSVLVLVASGTVAAIIRLPTLSSLFDTGYGQALVVKVVLLMTTLGLASVNLLRTRPRLARPEHGESATRLLRRLVGAEGALVLGAIFAAGVMSSVAPPARGLAQIGAAKASVGPGAVDATVDQAGYQLRFSVTPNRATRPNAFAVAVSKDGKAVSGADVTAKFTMLDMDMGAQTYRFKERAPAVYSHPNLPALIMVGHWGLQFEVTPPGGKPFDVLFLDRALG